MFYVVLNFITDVRMVSSATLFTNLVIESFFSQKSDLNISEKKDSLSLIFVFFLGPITLHSKCSINSYMFTK